MLQTRSSSVLDHIVLADFVHPPDGTSAEQAFLLARRAHLLPGISIKLSHQLTIHVVRRNALNSGPPGRFVVNNWPNKETTSMSPELISLLLKVVPFLLGVVFL